jgi:hypothetical protein
MPSAVCTGENPSDVPKCMKLLDCYIDNACNPSLPCATDNDGVCGVNTLQIDAAPQAAAIMTFDAACGADAGPYSTGTGDAGTGDASTGDAGTGGADAGPDDGGTGGADAGPDDGGTGGADAGPDDGGP